MVCVRPLRRGSAGAPDAGNTTASWSGHGTVCGERWGGRRTTTTARAVAERALGLAASTRSASSITASAAAAPNVS